MDHHIQLFISCLPNWNISSSRADHTISYPTYLCTCTEWVMNKNLLKEPINQPHGK
jgi:hypothetical protein